MKGLHVMFKLLLEPFFFFFFFFTFYVFTAKSTHTLCIKQQLKLKMLLPTLTPLSLLFSLYSEYYHKYLCFDVCIKQKLFLKK